MKLLLTTLAFSTFIFAKTLILIGGGSRPQGALHYFMAHKKAGPVYVLPWGTSYPIESYERIKSQLESIGADDVRCFCNRGFTQTDLINLKSAGAIYFPGGNQNRVLTKINRNQLQSTLINLYESDIPIAGTSAGTAIQSELMLTGNGSEVVSGLGTLSNFIVDQHYLVRNRQSRLLRALEQNPSYLGLGVDEDMSVAIQNENVFTALGPSKVIIYLNNGQVSSEITLIDGKTYVLDL